jgi:putative FmdB family regulatory protein
MPYYDYRCLDCRRRFELFMTYAEYGTREVRCVHCGSERVQRRIGAVRVMQSVESRMEMLADPANMADLEQNPRKLGQMMRQLSSETGDDMGAAFDEVVGRLERGQTPEDIERDIPELGSELGAGGDDFGD